ncbi:armadillo repeat-containing protein 1-like [Xiphophorus hellerii]|uniref:armadillo repeat-containing protein 1-like n=1 Tax=Xiphophorus hellerii TaxID=8084 RepID=UPI0013B44A76|nr:armadillo repeat-containing protein 1-like [Xiphophorus hellerii]
MLPRGSAAGLGRKNRRFGSKRGNKPKTKKFRPGPREQNGNRTSGGGPDRTGVLVLVPVIVTARSPQAAMSGEPDPPVARGDPVPDPLAVVTQLRDLAADPMNRRAIVQDHGCLPGLILFLDHPDPQVVYCALLAVRYLAECRANREKLKAELGMMLSLQNVVQKSTTPGETKLLASEIYQLLQTAAGADEPQAAGPERGGARRKAQFFLGSSNKRAKTVILQIHGLDDPGRRSLCEEALLKIRGVISFTFQMAVKRCVIRIRSDLKAEALASAIAATEVMTAQQVVKDENGDEILVHFTEAGSVSVEQNLDLPEYLPEEESPSQDPDKAISRVGSGQDGSSWFGAAANFLSRSFYW